MNQFSFIVLAVGVFLLVPIIVCADCLSVGGYSSYVFESDRNVVFYRGSRPIASVKLRDCRVYENSSIRIIKSNICNDSKIIVDGQECTLFSVDSLAF